MDLTKWSTLTLTHVIYPKGDLYGKFLALFSLTPFAIIVAFFTLTIFVRDIHVIFFFVGQVLNELLNTILKHWAKEGRPEQIVGQPNSTTSYGWPSSHCQFQAFFATYSTLVILFRLSKTHSKLFIAFLLLLNIISLIFIIHSRIYLLYHFPHQCIHGLLIGSGTAIIWYFFIGKLCEPIFNKYVLQSYLNRKIQLSSVYLKQTTSNNDKKKK